MSQDPLWYKDAVFYELHVKAFQDSNADGMGDFQGLIDRLDYVQGLGVDCIWLLPFFPSPLRDDGYDIADYYGINPSYGRVEDFERFMEEAHRRGLRVIADLVLNHTSSDHPWFQRARRAPKGSPEREWYVWSDTDELYQDARIIFTDTEPSNWTWDPVAGQYYWHRFFAHQPDLNWDNPEVKETMFQVMEFWLDRGLDGFRADAVPYLIERPGTICENLPETHDILKEFRVRLESKYTGRVLLAEANQWPDDVRPYFGDGDEFHMAFHFPLMPRIFMAVRQGIRRPIVDIIQRTPPIPDDCQWCMFLRNHDELTLEMVTDDERDYMYREYAADSRMRINLGIRRRLAPLMDNDRRKIELLNSILFTMPGSPVIYYGDEIGMGDNIWLGDRDGVRTPMQWTPDRNAQFSRAEPARMYLPAISDSVYGFQSVNVEAQERSQYSLLNWMKRLVQVRKSHRAFGRGSIEFLEPENPHVLAYLREYEGDTILVVNNLSECAQPVRLDLSRYSGSVPVELIGQTRFLPVDETPYALTLSPYGFFWFALRKSDARMEAGEAELMENWAEREARLFESEAAVAGIVAAIPHEWVRGQRWFRGKARDIAALELFDHGVLESPQPGPRTLLAMVRVRYAEGEPEVYLIPLTLRPGQLAGEPEPVATVPSDGGDVRLYDALADAPSVRGVLHALDQEREVSAGRGAFRGHRARAMGQLGEEALPVRRINAEQSNTSLVFGDRWILKGFRKLEDGINPDLEIARFLVEHTGFRNLPGLAGWVEYEGAGGKHSTVAALFDFVPSTGDAWAYTLKALDRYFAAARRNAADPTSGAGRDAARRMMGEFLPAVAGLGTVTGQLHAALASAGPAHPSFQPEAISREDIARWTGAFQQNVGRVLEEVGRRLDAMPGVFPAGSTNDIAAVVRDGPELRQRMRHLALLRDADTRKTRLHGDYHLGQVLRTENGEWMVLDFEGEPARPLAERRDKHSPLRDVAGMLRSFDYALRTAFKQQDLEELRVRAALEQWAEVWLRETRAAFLNAYRRAVVGAGIVPDEDEALDRVLSSFELEKAVYEMGYELNNRPDWIWIPVQGIRAILARPE